MELNYESLQLFIKGLKTSRDQHAEDNQTIENGVNGRLYSKNGKLAFCSIDGTIEIYNNPKVVKYLGWFAFSDELVLFVKYDDLLLPDTIIEPFSNVVSNDITIDLSYGQTVFNIVDELSNGAIESISTLIKQNTPQAENLLENNYSSGDTNSINLQEYYTPNFDLPNYEICEIETDSIPDYNKEYVDAIIVIRKKADGLLYPRVAWIGMMNWDINRKITTVGVFENNYYKRVYFTDNLNYFRVLNLKDKNLSYRTADEFNTSQNSILLQPQITEIKENGSLKAMSVQYTYILISENGQKTPFAPFSEIKKIPLDQTGSDFEGGDVSQTTGKTVIVQVPVASLLFKSIQVVALEYEANTIPTSIRNLGIQPISEIVEFIHHGNEPEFDTSFNLEDIIDASTNWKYCSDITTKNNKIIAGGLRNEPYSFQEKDLTDLMLFKGWNLSGDTHETLINPEPYTYQYFDPTNEEESLYLKKRLFRQFLFFGSFTLTLKNISQGYNFSISFESSLDEYIEYIDDIWIWLEALQTDPQFNFKFPNLLITFVDGNVLFSPINENVITDFSNYVFSSSITQSILDFENEYQTLEPTIDVTKLVYGAQSHGFNRGAGVRVSWLIEKDALLNKSKELYEGGSILNLPAPTQKKTFVKDEIYRLGLQMFKQGVPLFTIVLGDVKTPAVGDSWRYINEAGEVVIVPNNKYVNQSQFLTLDAHRLEMRTEVRIPCSFKKYIDSYQIVYVERTVDNRTVIAQGLSAPLVRLGSFINGGGAGSNHAPNVFDKWTLPFNGGPLYSANGFTTYDDPSQGENWNEFETYGWQYGDNLLEASKRREIVNRKMIYFDSPDFIQGKIDPSIVPNTFMKVLGTVIPDHTANLCRSLFPGLTPYENYQAFGYQNDHGLDPTYYQQLSFSRKIGYNHVSGLSKYRPYTINLSIFSRFLLYNSEHQVDKSSDLLNKGEIIPSSVLDTGFEISNNALSLFAPDSYYSGGFHAGIFDEERFRPETAQSSKRSEGYPTLFIRTETPIWTDELIDNQRTNPVYIKSHVVGGWRFQSEIGPYSLPAEQSYDGMPVYDVHAIVNMKTNNQDSVYGGRTKYNYSQNKFIPLSKLIPAHENIHTNESQIFNVEGDFYLTLFLRMKNDNSHDPDYDPSIELDLGGNGWDMIQDYTGPGDAFIHDYTRGSGWMYGVVLETEIESRFSHEPQFYKSSGQIDIDSPINEFLNEAYLKKNDLRIYSPLPYEFRDDPLLTNIISASKTKLSGDYFDSWTVFLLNEFYELEKSKGAISNVTNWQDEVFVIQERESNKINIDTSDFITTEAGERVSVAKGTGQTFTSHDKISNFGTSIRRALAEGDFGFSFIDEKRKSFIKFNQPISLEQEIEFKLQELFGNDPIIDTEGYYDSLYKETNIRIRTKSGKAYCLSYNEIEKIFNGFLEYDNDVYIMFDERVFAPIRGTKLVDANNTLINSSLVIEKTTGQWFYYQITATEISVFSILDPLPSGLSFNTSNGIISGFISVSGVYQIRIQAQNDIDVNVQILVITISDTLPVVTSDCPIAYAQGVPFNYQIEASGDPYIFDVKTLPVGLSVSDTGLITGITPVTGTYPITIYVENSYGSATKACSIVISNLALVINVGEDADSFSSIFGLHSILTAKGSLAINITGSSLLTSNLTAT
jgi:hypothetical protein